MDEKAKEGSTGQVTEHHLKRRSLVKTMRLNLPKTNAKSMQVAELVEEEMASIK